jgi:hypothetical protein
MYHFNGAWGSVVVKALRYLSDDLGIVSQWSLGIFSVLATEPCAPGSTQPLKNEYQGFLLR